eukprot:gene5470-3944_t
MKEDGSITPGSKNFWDHFYDEGEGRLIDKEWENRKAQEVKEGGSLLDHYEWFMTFERYGPGVVTFLETQLRSPAANAEEFRVLHVGCGNSDFCSHFTTALTLSRQFSSKKTSVLNVDICESIIERMKRTYPDRLYAVGNCCQMQLPNEDDAFLDGNWYRQAGDSEAPLLVQNNAVEMVFDKGTLDALLSAFPGDYNPNAQMYAEEAIRICAPGGVWYIISINDVVVVDSYVLAVSHEEKSFRRVHQSSISLSPSDRNPIRIETLGSRYLCFGYVTHRNEQCLTPMISQPGNADLASPSLANKIGVEEIQTGDILFFNRKCLRMQSPFGAGICLLTKTANRFDHVGSSSNEMAVCPLLLNGEEREKRQRLVFSVEKFADTPYQTDVIKIIPSVLGPPDKLDRIEACAKIHQLDHEIHYLSSLPQNEKKLCDAISVIIQKYREAQGTLLEVYFPSIIPSSWDPGNPLKGVNFSFSPFAVDGINQSDKMVCSELICNLWLESGITGGYIPASSQRPFDFLDPVRLNFTGVADHLGSLLPLKVTDPFLSYWPPPVEEPTPSSPLESRLEFMNKVLVSKSGCSFKALEDGIDATGVQQQWVVQGATAGDLLSLPYRLFCCAALFSGLQFCCAPWTIQWMEAQAGCFLVKGGMWSLASTFLLRGLTFGAIQSLLLSRWISSFHLLPHDVMCHQPTCAAAHFLVDTCHPFYLLVESMWLSSAAAHVLSSPVINAGFFRHFVVQKPGPISLKFFFSGAFSMLPFSVLLPFQCFWLSWYETVGSFILPMRSSVLRPREDILPQQRRTPWHMDALCSAFAATLAIDAAVYPIETLIRRRLLQRVYAPQPPPKCYGKRWLYAGYRYRFFSNIFILTGTSAVLGAMNRIYHFVALNKLAPLCAIAKDNTALLGLPHSSLNSSKLQRISVAEVRPLTVLLHYFIPDLNLTKRSGAIPTSRKTSNNLSRQDFQLRFGAAAPAMNAPQTLHWTRERRRQQISEMLRNKGYICRDFLCTGGCPRGPSCPYMHIRNGEVRPIPRHVCAFFKREVCLRDQCTFFHGTQEQLDALHAQQAETYRPQDFMQVVVPPAQYLEADGTIKAPEDGVAQTIIGAVPSQPQIQAQAQPYTGAVNPVQQATFVMPGQPIPVMFMTPNTSSSSPFVNATPGYVQQAAPPPPPQPQYISQAPQQFSTPTPQFVTIHPSQRNLLECDISECGSVALCSQRQHYLSMCVRMSISLSSNFYRVQSSIGRVSWVSNLSCNSKYKLYMVQANSCVGQIPTTIIPRSVYNTKVEKYEVVRQEEHKRKELVRYVVETVEWMMRKALYPNVSPLNVLFFLNYDDDDDDDDDDSIFLCVCMCMVVSPPFTSTIIVFIFVVVPVNIIVPICLFIIVIYFQLTLEDAALRVHQAFNILSGATLFVSLLFCWILFILKGTTICSRPALPSPRSLKRCWTDRRDLRHGGAGQGGGAAVSCLRRRSSWYSIQLSSTTSQEMFGPSSTACMLMIIVTYILILFILIMTIEWHVAHIQPLKSRKGRNGAAFRVYPIIYIKLSFIFYVDVAERRSATTRTTNKYVYHTVPLMRMLAYLGVLEGLRRESKTKDIKVLPSLDVYYYYYYYYYVFLLLHPRNLYGKRRTAVVVSLILSSPCTGSLYGVILNSLTLKGMLLSRYSRAISDRITSNNEAEAPSKKREQILKVHSPQLFDCGAVEVAPPRHQIKLIGSSYNPAAVLRRREGGDACDGGFSAIFQCNEKPKRKSKKIELKGTIVTHLLYDRPKTLFYIYLCCYERKIREARNSSTHALMWWVDACVLLFVSALNLLHLITSFFFQTINDLFVDGITINSFSPSIVMSIYVIIIIIIAPLFILGLRLSLVIDGWRSFASSSLSLSARYFLIVVILCCFLPPRCVPRQWLLLSPQLPVLRNVYDPLFMRKVKRTLDAYRSSMHREAFVDIDEKGAAWYLGHMRSATTALAEKLKDADFVMEIRDARLPFTTMNPQLDKLVGTKPRLTVFNKAELANEDYSRLVHQYYESTGAYVLFTDARRCWRDIVEVVQRFAAHLLPPQRFRTTAHVGLVVGLPNVGKSTLINSLRLAHEYQFHREDFRRSRTPERIAITPGTTRALKMVPISRDPNVVLYDSPGVTLAGCFAMEAGIKLAACGIIPTNDISLPCSAVARYIFDMFAASGAVEHLAQCLRLARVPISYDDCIAMICERSGPSAQTDVGNMNSTMAESFLLHDFQLGNLGRVTLDPLPNKMRRMQPAPSMSIESGQDADAEGEENTAGVVWHHVATADVVDRCPDHMRGVMNALRGDPSSGSRRWNSSGGGEENTVISRKKGPISRASVRSEDWKRFTRLGSGR